jgi:chromate transporter
MNIYLDLFLTFMKIGAFTFGGGYAMIALIEGICVEKKQWFTHEEMMELTVIAESTPGPIAINSSTYVGYKQAGFWGALVATLGMVLPSFCIIFLISMFFDRFLEYPLVANAFQGIKVGVGLIICNAGLNMMKKMKKDLFFKLMLAAAFLTILAINVFALNMSTIAVMLCAVVVSLAVFLVRQRMDRKGGSAV